MDYKDSLIMPKTEFEMRANLKDKEPAIQEFWIQQGIYQKLLEKNKDHQSFTLHDGPPYANGNIHVGHALNKTLKDFIVRFKSHQGYYTNFIPGWDTHGLPIENAIAKIDKEFEKNFNVIERRKKCKQYALAQVEIQKKQFQRLGTICDFKNIYLTLNHEFVMDEVKLFMTMIEKGLVFQDYKPIYWSWSTKSALAEAEIEYENATSPSIYVCFQLVDENAKLVIWTTTPWTIPCNLAIAVNPLFQYSYVNYQNESYIIASELVEQVTKELAWHDYQVIKQVSGKELENKIYKHPFIDRKSPVILAEYVSNTNGTGLVHNAPGFGLDDYYACKKYNIDIYCPIDDDGKYTSEINDDSLVNVFYLDANDIIIEKLIKTNSLLKKSEINHSIAFDWRTHKPIMYRATKQWFINIDKVKKEITNSLNDVGSLNKKVIERIKEMVANRNEWCISRQRVWGVPLTIIYDENKKPLLDIKLLNHIYEILNKQGIDTWFEKPVEYFIPDWMDQTKKYFKEQDILDVWFDSGSSYNVLSHYNLVYPADLYLEGSDQFRGWFNSSAINGTIQNHRVPYKFLLQHGFVLDEKGFKMSKSKGNSVDPIAICNNEGADILRLWVASSEYQNDLRFGKNILNQVIENYKKIRNTLFRYTIANLNDFNPETDLINLKELRLEDQYVLSQLKNTVNKITAYYEKYDFLNINKLILNFTNELSQWYFDLIKDSLYCEATNSLVRKQIQTTLYYLISTLVVVLNPIIPHTCEELYKHLKILNKQPAVMLEPWPTLNNIDFLNNDQQALFDQFMDLKDKVYQALEVARKDQLIKKNNEATVYLSYDIDLSERLLSQWLNVAKIVKTNTNEIIIKNEHFKRCERCWNHFEDNFMFDSEICIRCSKVINKK